MKIAFACTNYNNSGMPREAVHSLSRNESHRCQIIVVKDGSNGENVNAIVDLAVEYLNWCLKS